MTSRGDLSAFEVLYKEHFTLLCLVAFQITKNQEAAKDIVQDFFIYFWKKHEQVDIQTSFKAYACKAVKNLSLQYVEKLKKQELKTRELSTQMYEAPVVFEQADDSKTSKIRELVNQIPESRRHIFISHVVDGLSYSQIAEAYGISVNTVKTQMKRSYAFLRSVENSDLTAVMLLFIFETIC